MCDTCTTYKPRTKLLTQVEIYAYDPTRTLTLRRAFVREVNKRFRELTKVVRQAIVEDDCFGLQMQTLEMTSPGYRAFAFPRSADKMDGFMRWLQQQVDRGILETRQFQQIGSAIETPWTNTFIYDSYKRGTIRARYELNRAGYNVPTIEATGGIDAVLSAPFHIDRLGVLYTRTFSDLKGITSAMDTQISRILAQGLADGDHPSLLARKLVATINGSGMGDLAITDTVGRFIPAQRRAQMLAQTEVIRAHHKANMQEYISWGAQGVEVIAEFITAGDDQVCTECAGYHGNEYDIKTAENMIPVHPNCRCIVIPVRFDKVQQADPLAFDDDVANNFKSAADGADYLKYKKEYSEFWAGKSVDDLKLLRQGEGIKNPALAQRRNDLINSIYRITPDMNQMRGALSNWQGGLGMEKHLLKYRGHQLEKGLNKVVMPRAGSYDFTRFQQMIADIDNLLPKEQYLRFRALNQAYMERMGYNTPIRLYRGTNGRVGVEMAERIRNSTANMFECIDTPLTGYSSKESIAKKFSYSHFMEKPAFYVQLDVPIADIVIHRELLSGFFSKFFNEAEFIILGRYRMIPRSAIKFPT